MALPGLRLSLLLGTCVKHCQADLTPHPFLCLENYMKPNSNGSNVQQALRDISTLHPSPKPPSLSVLHSFDNLAHTSFPVRFYTNGNIPMMGIEIVDKSPPWA